MGEKLWHTLEDIPRLAEGLILATGKDLNSCLKIADLIIDKDKRVSLLSDSILEKGEGALRVVACASGIPVAQFCSGHGVRPANWAVSDDARKHIDHLSLGIFLPPRFTRRSIIEMIRFLW